MLKKIIALLGLGLISVSSVYAVNNLSWVEHASNLAKKKIINNHDDNVAKYNLYDHVLRQEIAAVARGVYEVGKGREILSLKKDRCDGIFNDVSSTNPNSWACYSIEALVDNNLIAANTRFRPEDKITKAETLGMLIKAIGFDYEYDTSVAKTWQEQIVDFAVENDIVERFTDYDTEASRGWVFQIADVTIKKDEEIKRVIKEKEEGTYTDEAL